jgi:phosphoribosylamine-glycine ligase
MYKPNDIIQEVLKDSPQIESCSFGTKVEESLTFRSKLVKILGISTLTEPCNGIQITNELWFNGEEVVNINYSMSDNNLMEGDKGPLVSSMGSVVWIGGADTRLYNDGIFKLIQYLSKTVYVGPISISYIITKDKLYATSITAGFSYNQIFIFFEMMKDKLPTFMNKLVKGKLNKIEFKSPIGIGIDLSILPYPLEIPVTYNIEIEGLNSYNLKHFWGYDICRVKDKFQTAGKGGRIGTVTARGDEIDGYTALRDARRRAYRTIKNIKVSGLMYRSDIGSRVERDVAQLKQWNWL